MPPRLRFELLFALGWIAFGVVLLPVLVYIIGTLLLGTYTSGGLAAFYVNLLQDALAGAWAALSLIFGPYVVLMLARLPLLRRARGSREQLADEGGHTSQTSRPARVEPRIGS